MGQVCLRVLSIIGSLVHNIWALILLILTALLQSDWLVKNIGFVPSTLDLISLWTYDFILLLLAILILYGVVTKRDKYLTWAIFTFVILQTLAFVVCIGMLTVGRFSETKKQSTQQELHYPILSTDVIVCIVAGVHCVGTLVYTLVLVLYIFSLDYL